MTCYGQAAYVKRIKWEGKTLWAECWELESFSSLPVWTFWMFRAADWGPWGVLLGRLWGLWGRRFSGGKTVVRDGGSLDGRWFSSRAFSHQPLILFSVFKQRIWPDNKGLRAVWATGGRSVGCHRMMTFNVQWKGSQSSVKQMGRRLAPREVFLATLAVSKICC